MDQIMQLGGVGIGGTILIGILAGWLAEKFTGSDHGLIMNLIIGQLIVAVIGACILILIYRAVKGRA